jgi:hypothetical protein
MTTVGAVAGGSIITIEGLAGGGKPSGPLSFMRVFDQIAGVVKSGGKTRRAAKMQSLRCDHPDIMEFIQCKANEEKKAWALIEAGYDSSLDGDAYGSVFFQNANNSVRVTDEFMRAVQDDGEWHQCPANDRLSRLVLHQRQGCPNVGGVPHPGNCRQQCHDNTNGADSGNGQGDQSEGIPASLDQRRARHGNPEQVKSERREQQECPEQERPGAGNRRPRNENRGKHTSVKRAYKSRVLTETGPTK